MSSNKNSRAVTFIMGVTVCLVMFVIIVSVKKEDSVLAFDSMYVEEKCVTVADTVKLSSVQSSERMLECHVLTYEPPVRKCVFIGDSRFVGMNNAVSMDDNYECIAKVGAGYDWLISTAIPALEELVSSDTEVDECVIVLGLGVNDTYNIDEYIDAYNELLSEYTVYVVSVNPVEEGSEFVSNGQIRSFNDKLLELDIDYIDCYSYLIDTGFETVDGVHYTADTYKKIYYYLLECISIE